MALGKTVVLFSEVEGRLVDAAGTPQPGIRIERIWKWKGKERRDDTNTGADGIFRFPEITDSSILDGILPHQPVITQDMVAHGPAGRVILWQAGKMSYERNSELQGRPTRLVCRIDAEPNSDGPYWGTCVEAE